ncbi:MAG: methylmalonyl-CoA mutase, partial [Desulfobacterales bacterium]
MGAIFKEDELAKIESDEKAWREYLREKLETAPERKEAFTTVSGREIQELYTPSDIREFDYTSKLGFPGKYPYTRGVQASMYRGRLWTMRMFAGLGSAEETNKRFHYLVSQGQTGLSTAFDMPTLMGLDTGDHRARGECGTCGVAIDTLKDMEILFHQLPVDKLTTSMTINPPAPVLWAMYIAMAEKKGIPREKLGGTIQNDMLKEFIAQKTFMCPPEPSMRLIVDTIEFGTQEVPLWNTISISGYHIREAGSTAVQELAFTLADGIAYVEAALERGLDVDAFAPRLSFFFNAHIDFFEEIAKYRAARRMWANIMKNRFKAKSERSLWLRFHTQTAGCSLTAQQPFNNVVRTAIEALSAVLGGTQSLHTNSFDEVLAIPTEEAATIALRTQQILAEETGVANTMDPLGGSYLLESLTDEMEEAAYDYIQKIDDMGGMLKAI